MRKVLFVAGLLLFGMVDLAWGEFSIQPATGGTINWIVGDDASRSTGKEFEVYPAIFRKVVLERLQPGDVVTILRLDQGFDQPDEPPTTVVLDRRLTRFRRELAALECRIRAVKRRGKEYHVTDFGLAMGHIRRSLMLNPSARYRIVLISDGLPAGPQTIGAWSSSPADGDWKLLVAGIHDEAEEKLLRFAEQLGFHDRSRVLLVPFSHWQETTYDGFLDRGLSPLAQKALARQANCP